MKSYKGKLKSAHGQHKAKTQEDELLQAQAEVKKKHKEVKELQRERGESACIYNIEKLQVSTRIQIRVVAASDQEVYIVCIYIVP